MCCAGTTSPTPAWLCILCGYLSLPDASVVLGSTEWKEVASWVGKTFVQIDVSRTAQSGRVMNLKVDNGREK